MSAKDLRWAMVPLRCADLAAVAIANKLEEVWICHQPVLTLMYAYQYLPFFARRVLTRFGVVLSEKFRSQGDKND